MGNREGRKENGAAGRSFVVSADQAERRLDRVLRGLYEDVPLSAIMKAIRKGSVRLNTRRTTGGARLAEGDSVDVPWGGEAARREIRKSPAPPHPPLVTLYRDFDIWCVDKPAGLLSQPDKSGGDSLITRVWGELSWIRRDFRPALIHRLDRNVSGVVSVALAAPVLRTLARLLREGRIRKIYRALVWGRAPAHGEIAFSLCKDEQKNMTRADESGKNALTRYRRIGCRGRFSLVELELITGRPHQARAHLASIAHPIAGDVKYGGESARADAARVMLHAYSLTFPDDPDLPPRVRGLTVESPLPKEFNNLS